MTNEGIAIIDKHKILALNRDLMEARFCETANYPAASESPILAEIHRRMVEALRQMDGVQRWDEWLEMHEGRREWNVALLRAKASGVFKERREDQLPDYVRDVLAPFTVSDELVATFISSIRD